MSGVVLLDGKPLADAQVLFHPVEHTDAARGQTDAQGRYHLMSYVDTKGAVPGQFKVTIHKKEPDEGIINMSSDPQPPKPERKLLIPEKYANIETCDIEVVVNPKQDNEINIDLKSR